MKNNKIYIAAGPKSRELKNCRDAIDGYAFYSEIGETGVFISGDPDFDKSKCDLLIEVNNCISTQKIKNYLNCIIKTIEKYDNYELVRKKKFNF